MIYIYIYLNNKNYIKFIIKKKYGYLLLKNLIKKIIFFKKIYKIYYLYI